MIDNIRLSLALKIIPRRSASFTERELDSTAAAYTIEMATAKKRTVIFCKQTRHHQTVETQNHRHFRIERRSQVKWYTYSAEARHVIGVGRRLMGRGERRVESEFQIEKLAPWFMAYVSLPDWRLMRLFLH